MKENAIKVSLKDIISKLDYFRWPVLNTHHIFGKELEIPREEREGFLANLSFFPEYKDPKRYPEWVKWLIVLIISLAVLVGPMGTSIIYPAIDPLTESLNTTHVEVNVSVGVYLLSLGIFPLWWSSLSEQKGRRITYLSSFTLLTLLSVGAALSPNIQAFIVFRMLCGAASASVQSVGAGTLTDIFTPEQRGRAISYFYLGGIMAPLISPIIGSLLVNRWSWRSTQWFMIILSVFNLMLQTFFLPETLPSLKFATSPRNSEAAMSDTGDDGERLKFPEEISSEVVYGNSGHTDNTTNDKNSTKSFVACAREIDYTWSERAIKATVCHVFGPLESLRLFSCPEVTLTIVFASVLFGVLYFINMGLQYGYSNPPYNFKPLYIGLLYIPNSVAYFIASMVGGRWLDVLLKRHKEKHGYMVPEARLSWNVFLSVLLVPVSLLIFGWCLQFKLHWTVPLVGTAIFGFGSMILMSATASYILDAIPGKGATGIALNNLVRQTLAAICVFVSTPLFKAIGLGWLFTILTVIFIASSFTMLLVKKHGGAWCEKARRRNLM